MNESRGLLVEERGQGMARHEGLFFGSGPSTLVPRHIL